jgi:hypothetical protein
MFSVLRDLLDALYVRADAIKMADTQHSAAEANILLADTPLVAAEAGLLDQRVFITVKAT